MPTNNRRDCGLCYKSDEPEPSRIARVMIDHNLCVCDLTIVHEISSEFCGTTSGRQTADKNLTPISMRRQRSRHGMPLVVIVTMTIMSMIIMVVMIMVMIIGMLFRRCGRSSSIRR